MFAKTKITLTLLAAIAGASMAHAQEIDATVDYRIGSGWLESFWLRVRGSWLHEEGAPEDGTDIRVILRYDFPVI